MPRGSDYDRRFEAIAAQGVDVHGEAALILSLGVRSVLDAGCGTGRVAIELDRRGADVVGIDLDPSMLSVAVQKAPHVRWVESDLIHADVGRTFDAVVMAGNVMVFVRPGTEGAVLDTAGRHLRPGGLLVAGFALTAGLDVTTYDGLAADAGFTLVDRWATWDREPFTPGDDYAVSVHRKGGPVR